ncbi:MAG TPA: PQQ-binding-like beta-propeller repeat protein [Pyrinomonadaceae bacterium]
MAISNTHDPALQTQPLTTATDRSKPRKPFRLWPGVVAAGLLVLLRYIVPAIAPDVMLGPLPLAFVAVMGGMAMSLVILGWWLFFSRAPWLERLAAILLMIAGLFLTYRLVDKSISGGAMGFLLFVLAVPILTVALVVWAVGSRRLSRGAQRLSMAAVLLLTCGAFTLIRTGGFTGDFDNDFHWRWTKTPEQRLLAQGADEPVANSATAATVASNSMADWPGFRGVERDGIVTGVRIETDWSKSHPVEMWRRPIGPGWSSFAVAGNLVFTQEQRGDDEEVACYDLNTGKPIWRHPDAARFWESNAGAGPRGTPTLNKGRLYTLGATGIVNALDAGNGQVIWTRNAATDTKTKTPGWGFSGSPLVVDDLVIVAAAGNLIAYNVTNGEPRWSTLDGGGGYSSPQLVKINGVAQVLLLNSKGAISVAPADGRKLWQFPLSSSARITQPAMTADGDVLVNEGEGNALRRIAVANNSGAWSVQERWQSDGLNPYFNDFVVLGENAFGFSGSSIVCIDLKNGELKWKGGNFGHGQLLLLRDQSLLVVLTEQGEIALVKAAPDQFAELARIPAIKGKTWNHPVLVHDMLLVRNGEEMAAFRLPLART